MLVDEHGAPMAKVLIAVPSGDEVKADFARSLALMMGYTTFVNPALTTFLAFVKGTYLPRARATLVQYALDHACTHILWLDSDMGFPKDTLLRLLGHGKDVVAANYAMRQPPILPTAIDPNRQPIFHHADGLVPAKACGMGVMLTTTKVFQSIGKPWFALGYNRGTDEYAGEDTFFCERVRVSGFDVWIDGPLSEQVEHVGGFAYQMGHARMTLDAALEQQPETAGV